MNKTLKLSPLLAVLVLGACATVPHGPAVMALPGTGKSFDEFKASDYECRQYADSQVGTTANDAAVNNAVGSAVVGTAVGALAGAIIGGHGGAAAGAGTGLVVGALAGSGSGAYSARHVQVRYDHAYQQCMYARGHRVPSGSMQGPRPRPAYAPPPGYAPPPPPGSGGYYPPPPPRQ